MFETTGRPHAWLVAAGLALVGDAFERTTLTDIANTTLAALIATTVTTGLGKTLAGRERPSDREDAESSYGVGRGFRAGRFRSLPSGQRAGRGTAHSRPLKATSARTERRTHRAATLTAVSGRCIIDHR